MAIINSVLWTLGVHASFRIGVLIFFLSIPKSRITASYVIYGLSWLLSGKESACSEGDTGGMGLIPGSGRSPGGGHGNQLQYSCPENPMDRAAWQATVQRVAQSLKQLKWLSTHAWYFYFYFFEETPCCFPQRLARIYIPTKNVLGIPFLYSLDNIC